MQTFLKGIEWILMNQSLLGMWKTEAFIERMKRMETEVVTTFFVTRWLKRGLSTRSNNKESLTEIKTGAFNFHEKL